MVGIRDAALVAAAPVRTEVDDRDRDYAAGSAGRAPPGRAGHAEARAGRSARPCRGGRRQPARPHAAPRQVSAAAGCVGHSRARDRRHDRRRVGAETHAVARPAIASARSSPAGATPSVRRAGAAVPADPAGLDAGGSRRDPRNVLHGLDQPVSARRGSRPARRVLVHGGTSGIGTTAIQLARAFGATRLRDRRHRRQVPRVRAARRDRRSTIGPSDFVAASSATRRPSAASTSCSTSSAATTCSGTSTASRWTDGWCRSACIGGAKAEVNLRPVLQKRLTMTGSTLRPRRSRRRARSRANSRPRCGRCSRAAGRPVVDATLPLARAADAHRLLEAGEMIGKVVLTSVDATRRPAGRAVDSTICCSALDQRRSAAMRDSNRRRPRQQLTARRSSDCGSTDQFSDWIVAAADGDDRNGARAVRAPADRSTTPEPPRPRSAATRPWTKSSDRAQRAAHAERRQRPPAARRRNRAAPGPAAPRTDTAIQPTQHRADSSGLIASRSSVPVRSPGVERGGELDEPDELGAVAVGIVAAMPPGERPAPWPRSRRPLNSELRSSMPELRDSGGEAEVAASRRPLRSRNRDARQLAGVAVRLLVADLDRHQLVGLSRSRVRRFGRSLILQRIDAAGRRSARRAGTIS